MRGYSEKYRNMRRKIYLELQGKNLSPTNKKFHGIVGDTDTESWCISRPPHIQVDSKNLTLGNIMLDEIAQRHKIYPKNFIREKGKIRSGDFSVLDTGKPQVDEVCDGEHRQYVFSKSFYATSHEGS
jgi:hypothetical protein